ASPTAPRRPRQQRPDPPRTPARPPPPPAQPPAPPRPLIEVRGMWLAPLATRPRAPTGTPDRTQAHRRLQAPGGGGSRGRIVLHRRQAPHAPRALRRQPLTRHASPRAR